MNGSRFVAVVLVVAGCAAALYLAVLAVQSAAGWLSTAEPLVAASLLAAVTILLAARILAGGLRARSEVNHKRQARAELYEQFLRACADEQFPMEQVAAERLILLAGPQVIKRLLEFRDDPTPGRFENLCLAMRSDLGHGNLGIPSGGLAKLVSGAADHDDRESVRQWITSKRDGDS